jgi:hypothetical protein
VERGRLSALSKGKKSSIYFFDITWVSFKTSLGPVAEKLGALLLIFDMR